MSPEGSGSFDARNPGSTSGTGGSTRPFVDFGVEMRLGRAVASGLGAGAGAAVGAGSAATVRAKRWSTAYFTFTEVSTDMPGRSG